MAAIARKIYLNKNSGVGALAKVNLDARAAWLNACCDVVFQIVLNTLSRHSAATSAGVLR